VVKNQLLHLLYGFRPSNDKSRLERKKTFLCTWVAATCCNTNVRVQLRIDGRVASSGSLFQAFDFMSCMLLISYEQGHQFDNPSTVEHPSTAESEQPMSRDPAFFCSLFVGGMQGEQ